MGTSFPVIYLAGSQLSVFNLALTPILMILYLADTSLFIDKVETLANGNYYPVPAQGPPTWWAEYYAILSLQWGDYAIFSPKWMPEIELLSFVQVWMFSLIQLASLPITII